MSSKKPQRTASMCTVAAQTVTHTFEVDGYNEKKGMGVGYFIRSATFTVGGIDWAIRFYPNGMEESYKEFVVIYLELMSNDTEVRAHYHLHFVSSYSEKDGVAWYPNGPIMITSSDLMDDGHQFRPRHKGFLLRSKLEERFVMDDRVIIRCDLTIIGPSFMSLASLDMEIPVPPSDMVAQFSSLLEDKAGVDVTFSVAGETFTAHKVVLAARSPVFKAEFFGPAREMGSGILTVEEMYPSVFRAMLHFIYGDVLPPTIDTSAHDYSETVQCLLVAADRYAIERLKLICQSILAKSLSVDTVAKTLDLAQQHGCHKLRDVCMEYMASLNKVDAMVAIQAYAALKGSCSSVLGAIIAMRNKF
ncbi:hypothetical protein ACP4OV_026897 [Aristida adscensionis]